MRGLGEDLTIGERVSWYRRRRGLSQVVFAGLVGRTVDWVSKIENGRARLDRLSVLATIADVLDVSVADLLGQPTLVDWTADSGPKTIPALRRALMSYSALTPSLGGGSPAQPTPTGPVDLRVTLNNVYEAYQAGRFTQVTILTPGLLTSSRLAVEATAGQDRRSANATLALTYQVAAATLSKLGENDLAWSCSERGLAAAEQTDDVVVVASLFRSVAHSLLGNAQYEDALDVVVRASDSLQSATDGRPAYLSVFGSLFLVGAIAAARSDDPATARSMLTRATAVAQQLGRDGNHVWTAFGPTNVAIHQVAVAMETNNVQTAVDLGPTVDVTGQPMERRVRHRLEVARALTAVNRQDDALTLVLDAESDAPEQVRYHYLARHLVQTWIRTSTTKPAPSLAALARRLRVA